MMDDKLAGVYALYQGRDRAEQGPDSVPRDLRPTRKICSKRNADDWRETCMTPPSQELAVLNWKPVAADEPCGRTGRGTEDTGSANEGACVRMFRREITERVLPPASSFAWRLWADIWQFRGWRKDLKQRSGIGVTLELGPGAGPISRRD